VCTIPQSMSPAWRSRSWRRIEEPGDERLQDKRHSPGGPQVTGKQRVEAALRGEKPDSVPVMLHNFMMAAAEANVSMAEYRSNPKALARCFIEAVERYGYDAVLVDVDTVTLAGTVGVPLDLPDHHPARSHRGCLASLAEVDSLKPVDISTNERVLVWLEGTTLLKQYFGDEIFIRGNCDQAPFSLARRPPHLP